MRIHCEKSNPILWEEFKEVYFSRYNEKPYGLWEESTVKQTMQYFKNLDHYD